MVSKKSSVAAAISIALGIGAGTLSCTVSAATLADGYYDMIINNTPFNGNNYLFGSDGAWSTGITEGGNLPSSVSYALDDDTSTSLVNGKYGGNPNDGVQGTVALKIEGGVITGTGGFEFDNAEGTTGGTRAYYGDSSGFTGSIDGSGNISLTPTGMLTAWSIFPSFVDKRWNVDNYNGFTGTTATPNSNTAYDSFTTLSASTTQGTINGAAFDGTTAILVKSGVYGSDLGGFYGAQYFEIWNVGFVKTGDLAPVPIPAAAWLFGSGLLGLIGISRKKTR